MHAKVQMLIYRGAAEMLVARLVAWLWSRGVELSSSLGVALGQCKISQGCCRGANCWVSREHLLHGHLQQGRSAWQLDVSALAAIPRQTLACMCLLQAHFLA